MRDIFLAPHQLGSGGRTAVIADQCQMFFEEGFQPTVLTFRYSLDEVDVANNFHREYGLPSSVKVKNIYSDYMNQNTNDFSANWSLEEDDYNSGLLLQDDEYDRKNYIRYFTRNGDYVKFRRWQPDGTPVQTTYFRNRQAVLRRNYTTEGFCGLEQHFDFRTGNINQERYYTPDGFCYASRWLNPEHGRQAGLYLFNRATGKVQRFTDNIPWHVYWLESLMKKCDDQPILIAHSPGAANKVIRVDKSLAKTIFVWHESHLGSAIGVADDIRPEYRYVFERFCDMPTAVFATERQAQDLRDRYPGSNNIVTIPPVIRDKRLDTSTRAEPGRIGVFCRLAPGKRVGDIVRAMSAILQAAPEASLHIFGRGAERDKLEELARELQVADKVVFHGRVEQVGDEMARCQVTVSTSAAESFGLSIGESLAAGTPVVSYDIKYGPQDLIRDGIDGYVVPDGDQELLAARIVCLLKDPERAASMGRSGQQRVESRFSRSEVTRLWRALLAD